MVNVSGVSKNVFPKCDKNNVITDGDEAIQYDLDYPD